jgi:exodeoxyribonuclease V gamma subunit
MRCARPKNCNFIQYHGLRTCDFGVALLALLMSQWRFIVGIHPFQAAFMPMSSALPTGLVIVQSNRLEALADAVAGHLQRHPLGPLEEETFLVQSNAMAEWLKMELARAHGVAAALRMELPARFLWRAYRAVLGPQAVPVQSPTERHTLVWRFMALLPRLAAQPGFEPVAQYLGAGAAPTSTGADGPGVLGSQERLLQLAQQLADLFDQYQVYRADWLQAWAQGQNRLPHPLRPAVPLPADQAWQPELWRQLMQSLPDTETNATRVALHSRFLAALSAQLAGMESLDSPMRASTLPRRLTVFGVTQLPWPVLEALGRLGEHIQVLLALHNPCQYHWADTVDGRELLQQARRRQALRQGSAPLADLPMEDMHAHGHPLLSAWGRQSRDFLRQWDAFEQAEAGRAKTCFGEVNFFDTHKAEGGDTVLAQLQGHIRDLLPPPEQPLGWPATDESVVFHITHSAQREIEVLHDQLLHWFAHPPQGQPLKPRDVVVMAPDIQAFVPAIEAVFGAVSRDDARYIPWGLADRRERGQHPVLRALEWLLGVGQHRLSLSEVSALLEVGALARRFELSTGDLPLALRWLQEAGMRWGLNGEHRAELGLGACGEVNSAFFALQRLVMGYATGDLAQGHARIEPYGGIGGLEAGLAGRLWAFFETLQGWWRDVAGPGHTERREPQQWAGLFRALLSAFFLAQGSRSDDDDRDVLAALDAALVRWLAACDHAQFEEPLSLKVAAEAWLQAYEEPALATRFRASGVTFCNLMPMRAIPFEVVCLIGMNNQDFPRPGQRSDFDLLALPGVARAGDRSRRDDDRQLMLDAVLAARRALCISWVGRSIRTDEDQPPSVLVSEWRDHLAQVWGEDGLSERTLCHPLQAFGRRYFEAGQATRLRTYQHEWLSAWQAHAEPSAERPLVAGPTETGPNPPSATAAAAITLKQLSDFLRNPVARFFQHRLGVKLPQLQDLAGDDECFQPNGLESWHWREAMLSQAEQVCRPGEALRLDAQALAEATQALQRQVSRQARAGHLPLGSPGRLQQGQLLAELEPQLRAWYSALQQAQSQGCGQTPQPLRVAWPGVPGQAMACTPGLTLWLEDSLTVYPPRAGQGAPMFDVQWVASKLLVGKGKADLKNLRPKHLLSMWLNTLAARAMGHSLVSVRVGPDVRVDGRCALSCEQASEQLADLLAALRESEQRRRPWPTVLDTGLAWLGGAGSDGSEPHEEAARKAYDGNDRLEFQDANEPHLARLYADYESLSSQSDFEAATRRLYAGFAAWWGTVQVSPLEASDPTRSASEPLA